MGKATNRRPLSKALAQTGGEWLPLSAMLQHKADEPGVLDATKAWLIEELIHRRLQFRYLDDRSDDEHRIGPPTPHHDLPEAFWRLATIHWFWSSATFNGRTIHHIEVLLPLVAVVEPERPGSTTGRNWRANRTGT
jgi:hypothetical protein